VGYALTGIAGAREATDEARSIALEQTVELPEDCLTEAIRQRIVGAVEEVAALPDARWRAVISYDPVTIGDEPAQLGNLLFGNISLRRGIRIDEVAWPVELIERLGGPRRGVAGLRRACDADEKRPLVCAALKPLGLTAGELAEICLQLALAGVDLIKDDHGLADQEPAPFAERVARCQEAVERGNGETGGNTLYFPNLQRRGSGTADRLERVRSAGCRGVLVSPLLGGLDFVQEIADDHGLAVIAHPALAGAYFHPDHGIAPEILLGDLFRLLGADGVIYPNVGGRFPLTLETCEAINARLRDPFGPARPAFPVPGGGIDLDRVPEWVERYGPDTVLLIGGSLHGRHDLVEAGRELVRHVRAASRF
jgi:ribulose-bisphosphate carboxylase large chain